MAVKTNQLQQLLCLMFLSSCSSCKSDSVSQEMEKEGKLFTPVRVDASNVKYVSSLSYLEFLDGVQEDEQILNEFTDILKKSSFTTYFFETPKVTHTILGSTTFEFVLA